MADGSDRVPLGVDLVPGGAIRKRQPSAARLHWVLPSTSRLVSRFGETTYCALNRLYHNIWAKSRAKYPQLLFSPSLSALPGWVWFGQRHRLSSWTLARRGPLKQFNPNLRTCSVRGSPNWSAGVAGTPAGRYPLCRHGRPGLSLAASVEEELRRLASRRWPFRRTR